MSEDYKINIKKPAVLREPQDELYGRQRKIKVLIQGELETLCNKREHINFVSFSDNTLESVYIFDLIIRFSDFLTLVGVVYNPISQPIYCFTTRDDKYINIKICGQYTAWDLPGSVERIINFADIPDIVICKFNETFDPAIVIETTGTANVGNSQWQREGRKIGAILSNTPFIYQTYYSGTDRSQEVDRGQPREPTSLQVLAHIVYSIRYRCPSFAIYLDNPDVDKRLGFTRSLVEGRKLIANYLSLVLLDNAFNTYKEEKIDLEKVIFKHMRNYVADSVVKYSKTISRLDNDLPVLTERQRDLLIDQRSPLDDFIVKRIYDKASKIEPDCDVLKWNFNNFVAWTPGNIDDKPLIKDLLNSGVKLVSYKQGIAKVGICLNTQKLRQIIDDKYNPQNTSLEMLDASLPTLIFPGRIWKGKKKVESGDPESGELYAFKELFTADLDNKKTMNLLLYVFVKPPSGFEYRKFITKSTKLSRSFKYNADLVIVNNQVEGLHEY